MVADFFTSLLFIVPITAVITGQFLKQIVFLAHGEKLSWRTFLTDGGLPSSHSATMAALATTVYFTEGLTPLFYVTFFLLLIVSRDAIGVRRESGKHARILKQVMKKLDLTDPEHIKMLVGHSKTQVIAGLIWGYLVAIIMHIVI